MTSQATDLSPGRKAQHTARWARTMTKWLVTYTRRRGAAWNVVAFGGPTGSESRGIVDLLAIRKDHRVASSHLKRGDLLEIVLIQTKGGSAPLPTPSDVARLQAVAKHHRARVVVLATWKRGAQPQLHKLSRGRWVQVTAAEIFG
jgi:hypothetical protein